MKAGKTELAVDTLVRVTHVSGGDPDDLALVGVEGRITHPFPGLMHGSASQYVAGLWIEEDMARRHGLACDRLGGAKINLVRGDRFEVVEPSLDNDGDETPSSPSP